MELDSIPVSSGESLSGSDLESTLLKSSDDNTSTESSAANMSSSDDSESDWDLSDDADDEAEHANSRLLQYVRCTYWAIYACRYDAARNKPILKAPSQLPHILEVLKVEQPDEFREILRVNPDTFNKIVEKVKDDMVFFNNSNNPQQPVEEQLAITLYRFGHNGNAASQSQVAWWAAGGHGTVSLNPKRVMTAILCHSFMDKAVRFPTLEEKEEAKTWVEKHSCKAWRDGWCLVNGTLIPLYDRPHWYGESYFDRKCNYSLNIQVCH